MFGNTNFAQMVNELVHLWDLLKTADAGNFAIKWRFKSVLHSTCSVTVVWDIQGELDNGDNEVE